MELPLREVSIINKKGYVAVFYRSPSQNSLEFDNFILNFEKMLSDIILLILIFLLFLVILMRGQIIGRNVIHKQVKNHELIIYEL